MLPSVQMNSNYIYVISTTLLLFNHINLNGFDADEHNIPYRIQVRIRINSI